eukprot:CAMPEP_0173065572 /NCGR_PEP_ID=MMETSP1102-20130122/5693_1 /TAXON_ID=49646 /ORGANISM="Geminigera sp., Strain Caron Lab Isolate" /LENGTH=341 /DNA_ID=CAMNT_0013932859 /DNA_START=52 /DNA_END=1078 /DNA_ORIENTATION=+
MAITNHTLTCVYCQFGVAEAVFALYRNTVRLAFSLLAVTDTHASTRSPLGGLHMQFGKQLPKNLKDAVTQLRGSIQAALQNRVSRMDVEMPYAANFGVEGRKTVKAEDMSVVRQEDAEASDRELARLIAEMFKGTGIDENMVIAFSDSGQAKKAVRQWEFSSVPGEVIVIDAKGKKAKSAKGGGSGFGAKKNVDEEKAISASAIPDGTEVLLIVAPTAKQLNAIETAASNLGMGCLIILVNARLDEIVYASETQQSFFKSEFNRVFMLKPSPLNTWKGGVLFRSYPDDFQLCMPRTIGFPKILVQKDEMPTLEELNEAFKGEKESLEGDIFAGINPFNMFK